MATAAPKPCTYPTCGALVYDGSSRCEKHKHAERKSFERFRGSASERGYGWRWQKARKTFLSREENALCTACEADGIYKPATVVDHITPHRGDQKLFWDKENWQGLCKECHDRKTATEDIGFGRAGASPWKD